MLPLTHTSEKNNNLLKTKTTNKLSMYYGNATKTISEHKSASHKLASDININIKMEWRGIIEGEEEDIILFEVFLENKQHVKQNSPQAVLQQK